MQKVLIAMLLVLLGVWFLAMVYHHGAGTSHMMAGGMMGGGMMGGGMIGKRPQGVKNQTLPDQQSEGAQLVRKYCAQCHALPSPAAHTAQDWPGIIERMKQHMLDQKKNLPDKGQLKVIIDYLQGHAR